MGDQVLCDFDVERANAAQTGANIWNTMILVDEGTAGAAQQQPAETAAPAKTETKGNTQKPASQAKPQ